MAKTISDLALDLGVFALDSELETSRDRSTVEPAASKQVLDLRAREAESKDLLRARWDVYSMGLRMRRARR